MTKYGIIIATLAFGFVTIGRTQIFHGPNSIFRLRNTKLRILENINYLQQQGTTLQSAIGNQNIEIGQLTTDVAGLTSKVAGLILSIQGMAAQLASLTSLAQPKCPFFTREINSKCYFIERTSDYVLDAKEDCAEYNGRLAEPGPDAAEIETFVNGLNTFFSSEIAYYNNVGKTAFWISGAETGDNGNFVYAFSESSVASGDQRILDAVTDEAEHLALYLTGDNKSKFLAADPDNDEFPFICEIEKT